MLIALIISALIVTTLLAVWFDTDAFPEYMALFKKESLFLLEDFTVVKQHVEKPYSYPKFLEEHAADNFVARLFSCQLCLGQWLGLGSSLYVGILLGEYKLVLFFPAVSALGTLLYFVTKHFLSNEQRD